MKKSFLFVVILFACSFVKAQGVICVQHGTTAIFTDRLDSAIAKAQNGDYIYLPGGLIAVDGTTSINITKKLKIIGCGYHPDSSLTTDMTQLPATINFNAGSDSSLLTGVYLTKNLNVKASNVVITRCNMPSISLSNTSTISNILINENIIRGSFTGGDHAINITVQKNIIYGTTTTTTSSITSISFNNNIFLFLNNPYCLSLSNCLFQNNIFLHGNSPYSFFGGGSGANTFNNNLFVVDSTIMDGHISYGNIYNQNSGNIFVNYTSGSAWSKTQNFHLKAGCPGIGLGTDGTDVGVYGTGAPFKEGGIPFNPHYQSISIPNATNSSGMLNINIAVKAQNQ